MSKPDYEKALGIANEEIERLKKRIKTARQQANLWHKRVDEAAEAVKEYEDVLAENKRLREAHRIYKLLLDSCDKHCNLYTKVKAALGEINKIMKGKPLKNE